MVPVYVLAGPPGLVATITPKSQRPFLTLTRVGEAPVWIDADVAGPPLPAGRVSPELRGRLTLGVDGEKESAGAG